MKLRIGTRGSKLALRQTEIVAEMLRIDGHETEIVPLVSVGDKKQGTAAAAFGDKKDWISGLEEAVLADDVDLVLHSSKDVPLDLLAGTTVLPILERRFPFDVLLTKQELSHFTALPLGATIGTASLRRGAFLKGIRSDLDIVPVRGNITTRIERLRDDPSLFGIILARAGLERLALTGELSLLDLPPAVMIPAVNQGTLAVQFRSDRQEIERIVRHQVKEEVLLPWIAEREVIRVLNADCRSAVGVYAAYSGAELVVEAAVCNVNGSEILRFEERGEPRGAAEIGVALGTKLLQAGAEKLLHPERGRSKVE